MTEGDLAGHAKVGEGREVVRVADRVMEGIDAEQPVLLRRLERFANESA
jgi:hypothetical protein